MKFDELKKLCDEATSGPWKQVGGSSFSMPCGAEWGIEATPYDATPQVREQEKKNAAFIAAARTYMPKLIAVAEAAKGLRAFPTDAQRARFDKSIAALEAK